MTIKNILDKETFDEIVSRVNALTPVSQALWGKMTVSQMLAHLVQSVKVVTADAPPPRMFAGRLFGWALKKKLTDESVMTKNLPTVPAFVIKEDKDLEKERTELLRQMQLFKMKGEKGVHNIAHPFFGKLTGEQWSFSMWKHFDHHLRQFGV